MTDAPGSSDLLLSIAGAGTEYRLCLPHLLPEAIDQAAMLAAAQAVLAQNSKSESAQALRAQSMATFMLLCAGELDAAEGVLDRVIAAQAAMGDARTRSASELRLVQVLQRLGRVNEAVRLASEVVAQQSNDSPVRHFALHHLGKALMQAGAHGEARAALVEALALRLALGNAELIASTRQALTLLESRPLAATPPHEA
ncbi:hypothetical protein G8A07_00700 [Roseateles sp. DAIF2]|uniref:hypothetical protein n=1 Tax=Roseateles sp. DAIF2 TaxID=2714952 RepID=UPI0018A2F59F|nr:hypothetical protein [Roseateles sp. DAIF2]QPF71585.1 hypothetical protein G8A07_00700 [Roseateles sp. DAIF2]